MSAERLALRGKLAQEREKKLNAERKIRALAEAVCTKLNPLLASSVADLDFDGANALMEEINEHRADLMAALSAIADLERALQ